MWGNEQQRGLAHGTLLAKQIIDWLEFYMIRTHLNGDVSLYNNFTQFLQSHFVFEDPFMTEIDAIFSGMQLEGVFFLKNFFFFFLFNNFVLFYLSFQKKKKKSQVEQSTTTMFAIRASGVNLTVPSLHRDFEVMDLLAMNSYLEVSAMIPGPYLHANISKLQPACTQFLATESMTFDRTFWAGRNMDGETDPWRVTVTHLILFAIESTDNTPRIVSIMWPGFVGTLTGFNEWGVYTMVNAGNMGPSPVIGDLTPISFQMRAVLNTFVDVNTLTYTNVTDFLVSKFASEESNSGKGNGTSGSGVVAMIGWVDHDNEFSQPVSMFALEADRLATVARIPGQNPDLPLQYGILATNHFRVLGVDNVTAPEQQFLVYGMDVRTGDYSF
ncbi:hypothetical protein RFI_18648, partial [Reticulomyxa filosa]